MILVALALAPVLAIICFVYLKDKYEKEPIKHLLISFALGCLSILPAILLEEGFMSFISEDNNNLLLTAFFAFVVVAGSEELSKFIMLKWYAYRQPEFNEPYDGIVYGVMISLGFAAIENLFYVADGGISVALLRMFTAVPAHASFGVIMGYYFGLAWQNKEAAWKYQLRGLITAVLLHGTYDFFLMQNNYPAFALFSFLGLFISIKLSLKAINTHQKDSPYHPNKLKNQEIIDEDLN